MKVAISYPPIKNDKGTAFLSQNRQFQWTKTGNVIYPMVPAYAATLLDKNGHDVLWDDAIAQKLSYDEWILRLKGFDPDIVFLETKTPVVKYHWKIIDELKKVIDAKIVLAGDHVTAMPEESMDNSEVDFIITGGDYDFLLLSIVEYLDRQKKLKPGIYFRGGNTGKFRLDDDLDKLPMIDRDLTCWKDYSVNNGNYKYIPATYTMAARDCWWGKCTFCSWTTLFPGKCYRSVSVSRLLDEVGILIDKYKVKEIMDDSGSFPNGKYLDEFCKGMIKRKYNKINFDCNFRFNSITRKQYGLMGKAGFRFILYGLESASQETLDRVNKNNRIEYIERDLRWAKKAGLEPHITVMVGYPWETKEQMMDSLNLAKKLFKKGLLDSLQATIVTPYPGTPLFFECQKNGWLKTVDWNDYDMSRTVMKVPVADDEIKEMIKEMYKGAWDTRFLMRKVLSVRNIDDIRFLMRYGLKFLKKLKDF